MQSTNLKILLAEHYEAHLLVATLWLDILGYEYTIARTVPEAVHQATHHTYHAVLMDVYLPETNGYHAAQVIRAFEQEKSRARTPIIGMNADALIGDRDLCLNSGMDDYLLKPLQEQELQNKLLRVPRNS